METGKNKREPSCPTEKRANGSYSRTRKRCSHRIAKQNIKEGRDYTALNPRATIFSGGMRVLKLFYPGVFYKENDSFWVEFPDLEGCQSFADTLEEIFENAREALAAYCATLLEQGKKLNPPTDIYKIQVPENAFVSLVDADLIKKSQAVKKTLTIPSWLNEIAENNHVNFSGVLQEALMQKFDIGGQW